jgi:phosphorylcholine metabolism protein LicD
MKQEKEQIKAYTRRFNLQSNTKREHKQKFRYQDLNLDSKRNLNFWVKKTIQGADFSETQSNN